MLKKILLLSMSTLLVTTAIADQTTPTKVDNSKQTISKTQKSLQDNDSKAKNSTQTIAAPGKNLSESLWLTDSPENSLRKLFFGSLGLPTLQSPWRIATQAMSKTQKSLQDNDSKAKNSTQTMSKTQKSLQDSDPITMLNDSIVTTQNLLVKESKMLSKNPKKLLEIIDQQVMPVLATDIIAQLLVGKRWKKASHAQQKAFINLMKKTLVDTYATNVAQAGKYKIKIYPFLDNSWKKKQIIIANGKIINIEKDNSGADLSIYLLKDKKGRWKVYDVSISGVSILNNLKEQFANYKTLNDINKAIEAKNVKLADQK
ncbi:MlaC/ttg2D family ABC transporter substrate-binding protein [Facilibium subflavum]|uniref:MlaC/ttg2D family ABC transporter substrate-binding protein n=1 Tax=Facilibium subflavum TaxID=2219058 RepID=UPI000E6489A5|nr:ABC transporter substrate-binding protein [Facilibium subflavum]